MNKAIAQPHARKMKETLWDKIIKDWQSSGSTQRKRTGKHIYLTQSE